MENIGTEYGFCSQSAELWQVLGNGLMIVKIVIPIALIVLGIIMLGKAVISTDEKEIKKCINGLIKKFIVAIVIFFVPNIVTALFGIVNDFEQVRSDYEVCVNCITHPNGYECQKRVMDLDA